MWELQEPRGHSRLWQTPVSCCGTGKAPKVCPKGLPQGALSLHWPFCEHTMMETGNGSDIPSQENCHHQRQLPAPGPAPAKLAGHPAPFPSTALLSQQGCSIHTYKENEAGALIQLHGVGVCQLQHGLGVPGELVALNVVQHLHPALPRDHVSLGVQHDESRDACDGKTQGRGSAKARTGQRQGVGRKASSYGLWLWQEPSEPPDSPQLTEWGSGFLDPVSVLAEHSNSGNIQLWHCLPLSAQLQAGIVAIWCPQVQIPPYHPETLPLAPPSQCQDVAASGRAQFPGTHKACRQQWPGSRVCSFPEHAFLPPQPFSTLH